MPDPDPKIVVEGFIDKGEIPYVILTRNSPFYDTINANSLQNYFISGATVKMFDGTDTTTFQELQFDTAGVTASIYVGVGVTGQVGKTYQLFVNADGQSVHATTSIIQPLPLDSVWYVDAPSPNPDSLVQLMVHYSDPPGYGNYVRYFTKQNSDDYMPGYNSVFDDALINGTSFDFPLDRGIDFNDNIPINEEDAKRRSVLNPNRSFKSKTCECLKKMGEYCVYGMRDDQVVMVCDVCQLIDIDYNNLFFEVYNKILYSFIFIIAVKIKNINYFFL